MKYKKIIFTLLLIFNCSFYTIAQDSAKNSKVTSTLITLSKETIVVDSTGQVLPYAIWNGLIATGNYSMKPKNANDKNTSFTLYQLSEKEKLQRQARIDKMPRPTESKCFKTGETFAKIKTKDIHGNKINTKSLKGKIIVLNYWFTNCMPCVMEMPELNKIADKYQNDSSVVFISIALDDANTIEKFLKLHPFKYAIIDNGRFLTTENNITSYPTNVVVDQNGKVYFHTSGLAPNTAQWINKSIEELKAPTAQAQL